MRCSVVLISSFILAIAMNLITCRWGTDASASPIMTFSQDSQSGQQVGVFAAPFLTGLPWVSLVLGFLVPMAMLGVGFYIALRDSAGQNDVK